MKKNYNSFLCYLWVIIIFLCLILLSTPSLALIPGDFGSAGGGPPDGCVDFEDLMIFAMAYGSTPSDGNWNPLCDLYLDEIIDFEDLMIFAMHYGECECTLPSAPTLSDPGSSLQSPATYTVSWSVVSGATSYVLQEATSFDFTSRLQEYPVTNTSKSLSHTVTTTTTYYYRIAAVNDCGQGGWSNVEEITVVVTGPVHNLTKDTYYNTIQAALNDADSLGGDIIEVDDGTYNESITFPIDKLVILQSASGIRDNVIIRGANNLSTVTINGSSIGTTLSGFTITHTGGNTGRGIYIIGSGNLIIDNCTISGNSATADNTTTGFGGGIDNSGPLSITSSDIYSNTATTYGGGIDNDGTLTITGSTINSNDVGQEGGGIYLKGTGINTIGGNDASDTSNFNTFTDNKKDGIISADQHIRNSSGEDCRSSYPYNYYDPN